MQPAIYWEVEETLSKLKQVSPCDFVPQVMLTLGTGLGQLVENIDKVFEIGYQELASFAHSTVSSHAGRLYLGYWHNLPVALLSGRWHLYEGYDAQQITFPIRVFAQWGAKIFIFTNAAGGLGRGMQPGRIMLINDHINLTGKNPLLGLNVDAWGPRFPDMARAYDRGLLQLARQVAEKNEIIYYEGVYAGLLGPSLETPAETRMLQMLGASAVGMSTVLEVIAAHHHGGRALALASISNVNDPDNMRQVSLPDIIAGAHQSARDMRTILNGVMIELAKE